jgi:hypothetical protein
MNKVMFVHVELIHLWFEIHPHEYIPSVWEVYQVKYYAVIGV